MAFALSRMETAHAGKGNKLWTYDPGADAIATVEGAGYFDGAATHLGAGDHILVAGSLYVVTDITAGVVTIGQAALVIDIALATSVTVDGIDITITVQDGEGNAIAGVFALDVWISEAATGIGITAESYSGDVTVVTGSELVEHVAKKVFLATTDANGVLGMLAVDSSNEVDQYIAVRNPATGRVVVSAASGTTWEGA